MIPSRESPNPRPGRGPSSNWAAPTAYATFPCPGLFSSRAPAPRSLHAGSQGRRCARRCSALHRPPRAPPRSPARRGQPVTLPSSLWHRAHLPDGPPDLSHPRAEPRSAGRALSPAAAGLLQGGCERSPGPALSEPATNAT